MKLKRWLQGQYRALLATLSACESEGSLTRRTRRRQRGRVLSVEGLESRELLAANITDFGIYAQLDVHIGGGTVVSGLSGTALVGAGTGTMDVGDASLNGRAGIDGDLRAGSDVQLANNTFVTGSITNPGSFSVGSGVTVGSHVSAMPMLPALPAATIFADGVTDQILGNGATLTLSPGMWDDIQLGGAATLNLTAGDYYLKSFTAGSGLTINVNTLGGSGNVRLFITEDFNAGGVQAMEFTNGGDWKNVYVETHHVGLNAFRIGGGNGTNWSGTVFTPYGDIHLGSGSSQGTLTGYFWAGRDVVLEHSLRLTVPSEVIDPPQFDFGDAPENPIVPGDYPTTLANDGARHRIVPDFHLGAVVDFENDGQPNGTATGDDANNLSDEDGVLFNGPFIPGLDTSITVIVHDPGGLAGKLSAWFDWNGDGDWLDLGEQVFADLPLSHGSHNLLVSVPATAVVSASGSPTFARFRFSTETELLSTGPAFDGEVEDYKLAIFPYWTSKGAVISQIEQNTRPPGNVPDSGNCFAIPDVLVDVDSGPAIFDATRVGTLLPATNSIQQAVDFVNAFGVSPISGVAGDVNGDGFLIVAVTANDSLTTFTVNCGGVPHTVVGRTLGGDGSENYIITNSNTARLNVFGNSVNMHAANPANPVATIVSSVGKVTYLDLHTWDSNVAGTLVGGAAAADKNADLVVVKNTNAIHNLTGVGIWVQDDNVQVTGSQHIYQNKVGIQIEGNNNELRTNNEIMDNSLFGIKVVGSNNELNGQDVGISGHANGAGIEITGNGNNIHDSVISFNSGAGIKVTGNSNIVKQNDLLNNALDAIWVALGNSNQILENDIFSNGGDGIDVKGDSNLIEKNLVGEKNKGNGGDGIRVCGKLNQILENEIYGSLGDGIEVIGDSNTIKKNKVGDKSRGGNGLSNVAGNRDGIRVTGKTNLLEDNTVNANKGFGIYIAGATSTGNKLKNNKSNTESSGSGSENGLAEYKFEAAITNLGGNKKDNANFTATAIGSYE